MRSDKWLGAGRNDVADHSVHQTMCFTVRFPSVK
jgi:hypothetical protein